jgi:D-alanyl-D-alanine carboxypeptidase
VIVAACSVAGARIVTSAGGWDERPSDFRSHPLADATALTVAGRGTPGGAGSGGTAGATSVAPGMPVRLPACRIDDLPATRTGYDDWATTLVDTIRALPEDYEPPDLVPVTRAGLAGSGRIRDVIVADLAELGDAAAAAGMPVAVQSAYRSYERQRVVFAEWEAASGRAEALRFSARPGHSEHQLGTAVDLREADGPAPWEVRFAARPTGRWLAEHAWEYGFVLSYPGGAEARTCYGAEPWHVRYLGREAAAAVRASGLPLREWLWEGQ